MSQLGVPLIAQGLEGRSPQQIAGRIARLVNEGTVAAGDRLPIVQDVAAGLAVSAGTVAAAWKILASLGLVESRGRAGTFVVPAPTSWLPPRYRRSHGPDAQISLDLSTGTPDPSLLPDLGRALRAAAAELSLVEIHSYLAPPVYDELGRLLERTWPFHAQRITVVDGAMDGMIRTLNQVVSFGDRVAIENPSYPPIIDILGALGLVTVPLTLDRLGATPDSVRAAIRSGARALIVQPRAQNPTGVSMTPTRVRAIATAIRTESRRLGGRPITVIEDDHTGEIAAVRDLTIGSYLPDQVVHLRSYSKTHGPDLRISALGGPAHIVDPVVSRRLMGAGWTSRLLQIVLMHMLTDPESQARVRAASAEYARRRTTLASALADHGLHVSPGDGLTMWIAVHDEHEAMNRLLASGIRASAGEQFVVPSPASTGAAPCSGGHIRVTLGALVDDIDQVAALLAIAARA